MAISSPKFAQRRRRQRMVRGTLGFFGIIAICLCLVYVARMQSLLVRDIQVKGNVRTPTDQILSLVTVSSEKKVLGIVPRKNIVFFPRADIEQKIKDAWKRVEDVDIRYSGLHSAVVEVKERKSAYVWCGADASIGSSENELCYQMDENGYIFDPLEGDRSAETLSFYGSLTQEEPVGVQYMTVDEFHRVLSFVDTLNNFEIGPQKIQSDPTEYHIYLRNGTKVLIRKDQDLALVADHLKAALADTTLKTEDGAIKDLLYIDMRFANKVYYKLR